MASGEATTSKHGSMQYRLAESADLAQLAAMRWLMWLEDGEAPAQDSEAEFTQRFVSSLAPTLNEEWFAWCAIDSNAGVETIVSHIYIQRVAKLPKPSAPATDAFGYLTAAFTRAEYRDRGIGATLLEQATAWSLAEDLEFLVLWPSEASRPFWTRAGFTANESLLRQVRAYIN